MLRISLALAASLGLAGCFGATTPAPQAAAPTPPPVTTAPRIVAAAPVTPVVAAPLPPAGAAPATPAAAPAGPVAVSGALLGPVGQGLEQKDLDAAYKAQLGALESGRRTSWRGQKGTFGYVEVGSEGGLTGTCRDYTHVVYVGGRPRNGKGTACKGAGGEWTASS